LFHDGVKASNIERFLGGAHVVVDGIDFFAYDDRRRLFNESRRKGLYVLTSGPIGFGATLQIFSPDGMSFDDYFGIRDGMEDFEKFVAFATGIAPAVLHRRYMDLSKVSLSTGRGPVVASSCLLASALVATEAINVILKRRPIKAVPHYFQFDTYLQVYKKRYLWLGARNPMQYLKRFVLRKMMRNLRPPAQPPAN
jgi:molybdopterin/thiamine biosynthesis adenylyltransferase